MLLVAASQIAALKKTAITQLLCKDTVDINSAIHQAVKSSEHG